MLSHEIFSNSSGEQRVWEHWEIPSSAPDGGKTSLILIPAGAAAVFYIPELYSPGCKSTNQEIKTSDFGGLFYCEHNQSCAKLSF